MYTLQCNHRPNFLMFDYLRQNRLQYLLSLQPRLTNPTNKYQVLQLCLKQTKKFKTPSTLGKNRSINSILRILSENLARIIITQKSKHFSSSLSFSISFFVCLLDNFFAKSPNSQVKIKFLERNFVIASGNRTVGIKSKN